MLTSAEQSRGGGEGVVDDDDAKTDVVYENCACCLSAARGRHSNRLRRRQQSRCNAGRGAGEAPSRERDRRPRIANASVRKESGCVFEAVVSAEQALRWSAAGAAQTCQKGHPSSAAYEAQVDPLFKQSITVVASIALGAAEMLQPSEPIAGKFGFDEPTLEPANNDLSHLLISSLSPFSPPLPSQPSETKSSLDCRLDTAR